MPFCPNCRAEYVEGVTRCADCEVELVDALPPDPDDPADPQNEYEVLAEALGEVATRVVVAELEAAGLPYVLSGDELGAVHIYPAHDSKVWTPKRHLAQAREILDAILAAPLSEAESPDGQSVEIFFCDHCGAEVPAKAAKCPECGELFEDS
jgi:hypothetical protein